VNINLKSGWGSITFKLPNPITKPLWNEACMAIITRAPGEEEVLPFQASMAICLPESPEGHSLQGFSAEISWPTGSAEGTIEVQVADVHEDAAFHPIRTIAFPHLRFDTPAGISANFVRLMVTIPPDDPRLAARILVR